VAYQFNTISENDWGSGIDQQSAENAVKPGFVEDLVNGDPKAEGYIAKRVGYQGFAGNLPVRVSRVDYSGNDLCFTLDNAITLTSIDLSRVRSSPIYVQGKLSVTSGGGDFDNIGDSVNYYTGFTLDTTLSIPAGTGTLSIPASFHGQGTPYFLPRFYESTHPTDNSNRQFFVDGITINKTTYDMSIDYTNGTGNSFPVFVTYSKRNAGSYIAPSLTTVAPSTTSTINVSAATHGQPNFNLQVELWQDDGTSFINVIPDSVTINTAGQVTIVLTNNGPAPIDVFPVITAVDVANKFEESLAFSNQTLVINNLSTDFIGASVYVKNATTGLLTQVIPEQIEQDADSRTVTMTFGFNSQDYADYYTVTGQATFVVHWEDLRITANKLCVTAHNTIGGAIFDERPQLTIWGLDHSEIYGTAPVVSRPGWVNHIDSYKSSAASTVIAGLGGNIFAANQLPSPILYYPNLRNRVNITPASQTVAPAFWGLTDSPVRTAGYFKFAGGEENWARVSSVTWISGNTIEYVLSTPSLSVTGTPLSINNDQITIAGSGWRVNDGTFTVTAVTPGTNTLTIRVTNPNRDSADFNETDSGALAGIFTSSLTLAATSSFIAGDRLISDLFGDGTDLVVLSSSGSVIVIGNVMTSYTLPAGLTIVASRSGCILPLRTINEIPSIDNIVRGDMVTYNGLNRAIRILYVNPAADESVALSGDGQTLTITLLSTLALRIGQKILLTQAGAWDGEHTITDIPSPTAITVASTISGSGTATLVGKTIELDEQTTLIDQQNNQISVSVPVRWSPIEAPASVAQQTYVSHFPSEGYGEQAIIRSTMSSDNLYLTNGQDQVMKMDGNSIYRAGLPRWQPQAFITVDEDPSTMPIQGKIIISNPPIVSTARTTSHFVINYADRRRFAEGQKIYDTANHNIYTITGITEGSSAAPTQAYINVAETITYQGAGSHNLTNVFYYRYYFRLNAIDANNNIIISAITGYQDNTVIIEHPSQIRIRLIGFPAWDNYDYARLELQVYRTKLDQAAPFFLVSTVPLPYGTNTGYVDIVDTKDDSFLTDLDPSSVLSSSELGTRWSGPLRSKYITSAANKLILANVETDPQLDINILQPANSAALTAANFNGKRFLFRKDNTDSGTTTDNINRMAYEFRSTGALTITGVTNNAGTSFTVTTSAPHGLSSGNWVYLTTRAVETDWSFDSVSATNDELINTASVAHNYTTGQRVVLYSTNAPGGTTTLSTYYVVLGSTPFRLKLALTLAAAIAGTPVINLTGAGGSTGNLEPHNQIRLEYAGWWQVASSNTLTFTINHTHSASYVPALDGWELNTAVKATNPNDIPVWIELDDNYGSITGDSQFIQNRVVDRLSRAISASQRLCRTAGFTPWLIAGAGQDYNSGQIIITQPKSLPTITELQLPSFTEFLVFVNGVQKTSGESASTFSYKYPSRLLASYTNYPELFDNVTTTDPDQSVSVIDINSADGQQITGVIPFFGESAFGAALRSGVVVVFKTNSIYLVDLAEKAAGRNPVQRIESQGLGCTAPHSIANTRDGIMFANESGIYKLTRSMAVEYVGRKTERVWRNRVNRDALELAFGHHYSTGSQYKLAVPLDGGTSPGDLLVYSHVREYQGGVGAWSRYSHSPAIGWCNLFSDAFFASTNGRVYSIRRAGDNTDYRDDNQPIAFEATLRAMDFGDGGIRKIIHYVISKFRVLKDASGTALSTAADLTDNFQDADNFRLESPTDNTNGLNDANAIKVQTIRFSIDNRKLVFLQVRFTNSTIDEPVEITEVSVRVAGMTDKGITSAART
jgi:hypothetical protein